MDSWFDENGTVSSRLSRGSIGPSATTGAGTARPPRRPFSDVSGLRHLLRYLGVEEACLVGISNGGRVALEDTLAYPGMVGAMVLVGPGLDCYLISEEKRRRIAGLLAVTR